jgi:hypothetical protein
MSGLELIALERQHQGQLGFDAARDNEHVRGRAGRSIRRTRIPIGSHDCDSSMS